MINDDSLRMVDGAQWNAQFVKPLYDSYCFSQIPDAIRFAFARDGAASPPVNILGHLSAHYDRVILFFVDAFGWRFFERYYEDFPFLNRIVRDGVVSKLTSQFPSTTAAHVTAIHTGLPVGQSGIYEWFYYEPHVDAIIAPLLFSFAGDHVRNTLAHIGVSPDALYPQHTLYRELQDQGVKSFIFQQQDYTPSPYSDVVFRGAYVVPYKTLPEALATLVDLLLEEKERSYYFLYFDGIDATCHRHGPTSSQVDAEIDTCLTVMERIFHRRVEGKLANMLFMLTADHGQVDTDPATTIYINRKLPGIKTYLKTNRAGHLLVPAGSPRDMFLHVKDEYVDQAHAYLQERLNEEAAVYRVADLIDQHFFGADAPSPAFLSRVGNLVILPYEHQSVWWYEAGRFEQPYYGHHGGLTRNEMETMVLARHG